MKNAVTHYTFKYFFFICKLMSFIKITLVVVVVFLQTNHFSILRTAGSSLVIIRRKKNKTYHLK